MIKLLSLLCASLMIAAMFGGCVQKTAEDAADTASEMVSDAGKDADKYGTVSDTTDGDIADDATEAPMTMADMDEMIDNGVIDDENDDETDGDNIDDDALSEDDADNSEDDDDANGGDHNAETMNVGDGDFI